MYGLGFGDAYVTSNVPSLGPIDVELLPSLGIPSPQGGGTLNLTPAQAAAVAAAQLAVAAPAAVAASPLCLFGDTSAQVGSLPVCTNTLLGALALAAAGVWMMRGKR